MPPKFTSKQLQYDAPPLPSFLRQLHSQVNSGRGTIDTKRSGNNNGRETEADSEFDSLMGVSSSSSSKRRDEGRTAGRDNEGDGGKGSDEEEEWDGAQVVVLKEGRHLSKEEAAALNEKTDVKEKEEGEEKAGAAIAGPGSAPAPASSRTKRSAVEDQDSGTMTEAKELIADIKRNGTSQEDDAKAKRKEEKGKLRAEKNKRAKIEKSKRGKGLSFSMDDE